MSARHEEGYSAPKSVVNNDGSDIEDLLDDITPMSPTIQAVRRPTKSLKLNNSGD